VITVGDISTATLLDCLVVEFHKYSVKILFENSNTKARQEGIF